MADVSAGFAVGEKRSASEIAGGAEIDSPAKQQALATGPSSPPIHYAEAPADPNLPAPWQAHVSTRTGKPYWYNPDSKETTWICPVNKPQPQVQTSYRYCLLPV
jgi:hypothetical protein